MTVCLAFMLLWSGSAATAAPTVAAFLRATGGAERLRAVSSIRESGTITVVDSGRSSTGPALLEEKRPNKSRVERTIFGSKTVWAYDGRTAWAIPPGEQPQMLSGEMARSLAANEFDHFLLDYAQRGIKVEAAGGITLPSGRAHKLKVTLRDGAVRYAYIDETSSLEVRRDYVEKDGATSVQWFRGHVRINGVMRPTEYVNEYSNGRKITIKITRPEVDPVIDDGRFRFPGQ